LQIIGIKVQGNYQIFPGDTYEGHTLIPALAEIRRKYDIRRVVLVADSGMLSFVNIRELYIYPLRV
jgi:transposase